MRETIHLRMQRGGAALERVLGVLRYRGFDLAHLYVHAESEDELEAVISVSSRRGRRQIERHLSKLEEVHEVTRFRRAPDHATSEVKGGLVLKGGAA